MIAKVLDISESAVTFWISCHKNNGDGKNPSPKHLPGRPRKTNLRTEKLEKLVFIILHALKFVFLGLPGLCLKLGVCLSPLFL